MAIASFLWLWTLDWDFRVSGVEDGEGRRWRQHPGVNGGFLEWRRVLWLPWGFN